MKYVSGRLGEIILIRFDPHQDLRQGLLQAIREQGIRSGLVLSITGAVERATLQHAHAVGPPDTSFGLIEIPGPLEISGHGMIGQVDAPAFGTRAFGLGDDFVHGEPYLHVHVTVTSAKDTFCGHLMDGTPVCSIYDTSHFTVALARVEGAMIKMLGAPGVAPGSFTIGHELVSI